MQEDIDTSIDMKKRYLSRKNKDVLCGPSEKILGTRANKCAVLSRGTMTIKGSLMREPKIKPKGRPLKKGGAVLPFGQL